jgi:hypothetical protein
VQPFGHVRAGEVKVAPTITPRSSSTTRREVPGVLRPWKLAPAVTALAVEPAMAAAQLDPAILERSSAFAGMQA